MSTKLLIQIMIGFLGLLLFTSCHQVVMIVEEVPGNTPSGDPIYLTGNFNMWSPGEERYQMELDKDSNYYFTLPGGFGDLEYKFTRGSWGTVEKGLCGEEIENRHFYVEKDDSLYHHIESWNDLKPLDCPRCVLIIDLIPSNTPENDIIAIASDLNSWEPDDASIAKRTKDGSLYVEIARPEGINKIEYKVTRGDLSSAEADENGLEVPNRVLTFGETDSIYINVVSWMDLPLSHPDRVTLIINELPKLTPKNESIYLSSKLNSWSSGDRKYQFMRNRNNQLYYSFPRKKMTLDYKITRDGWHTVEVDKNGYDISNRQLNLANSDTIYIDVLRWKDQENMGDQSITLILKELPKNTPPSANIYAAGEFSNWNPGQIRYLFKKDPAGYYYVHLPRRKGSFEFKITRGSWESLALDPYGSEFPAHRYEYSDFDTLIVKPVGHWQDLPMLSGNRTVSIIINSVPQNTHQEDKIYLASDLNDWNPEDEDMVFQAQEDGKYRIRIPYQGQRMSYKITRGGWSHVEKDEDGAEIGNRVLHFGFSDQVYIDVAKWGH